MGYDRWEDAMVAQARLYEGLMSAKGREYMDAFQADMNRKHEPHQWMPDGFHHAVMLRTLATGEPVWVSPEVTDLIDHARHSFQLEPVRLTDPFVPSGFCLFPRPIMLRDAPQTEERPLNSADGLIPIRAIAWTALHSEDMSQGAFWISYFVHTDDDPGHFDWPDGAAAEMRRMFGPLTLGHLFQWSWGTNPTEDGTVYQDVTGEPYEDTMLRARAQGQLIQTLWRLSQQFVPAKKRAPRQIRRDFKRKVKLEAYDVNVVVLRRSYETDEDVEPTGRTVNVTSLVRGYWGRRHTREGPRQVWVAPYIRGHGPFKQTERAWEFRR